MPMPAKVEVQKGEYRLTPEFRLGITGQFHQRLFGASTRFLRRLDGRIGLFFKQGFVQDDNQPELAKLKIQVNRVGQVALYEDESYELNVSVNEITLKAENDIGAMRGLETLLQLLKADEKGYYFPAVNIQDAPRFPWRGLMIDVARHFQPMDVIKRNLDAMAAVKMNVLHLHLTDDQGFRIESKVYPKLHQLGSDGMYFTQIQIKEIIKYADDRGIRVVPEFDVPGHATTWVRAYPELGSSPHQYIKEQESGNATKPYHIERNSGIFDATLDPTKKQTYTFLKKLFKEMAALFPDPYFHIGGDENEGKQWDANPAIQAFMKKNDIEDNHQLQTYFNRYLLKYLTKYGKKMIGWDEILQPDLPKTSIIHSWRGKKSMYEAAKQGYESVLSAGYYIDLMFPAWEHYTNDPLGEADSLTTEQKKRILGGEATIWSELVTPYTIDSRVWPRTAAIAERLWSPAHVNDIEDMYRRMEITSWRLEELGIQHIVYRERILRNLANGGNVEPIRDLIEVIEPLKGWNNRNKGGDIYQTYSPFTLIADAANADAKAARRFNALTEKYLLDFKSSDKEELIEWLTRWKNNHQKLKALMKQSPVLKEAEGISSQLHDISELAIKALQSSAKLSKEWHQAAMKVVGKARKPGAKTTLQVVDAIEALVNHCCGFPTNYKMSSAKD